MIAALAPRIARLEGRGVPRSLPPFSPLELAEAAGFTLDPWQQAAVVSSSPRLLLNCARQSGKSTVVAIRAVHTALYAAGSLCLLLSPTQRQSSELFRSCLSLYRACGRPVPARAESALSLTLANRSRLISLPSKEANVRCYSSVALLAVDEASRVPDELYYAIRPMLAVSGGSLIALSTPWGTRGWWHGAWTSDEPWERYEVPGTMCPRISPEFLAEEKRTLGDFFYAAEYECSFLDAQTQAFTRADVEAAFTEEVNEWTL